MSMSTHCTLNIGNISILSCMYAQVRAAYRKRGWAFTDPQQIDQCAKEGYVTKLKEQEGEGCHMWGHLQINKVTMGPFQTNTPWAWLRCSNSADHESS